MESNEPATKYCLNKLENWEDYRYQTEHVAYYYTATDILNGAELRPANLLAGADAVDIAAQLVLQESWDKRNRKLHHYLFTTQSAQTLPMVKNIAVGDSTGMWKALKAHHESGTDAQIVNCMDRALDTRLESSVISFISNLQARRHELAAVRIGLSVANAVVGAVPIHLEDIIMQAVMFRGLGRDFDFTSERLKSTPRLTWDQAEKGVLQKDEQLRYDRQRKGLKANSAAPEEEASGYQVSAAAAAAAIKFNGQPKPPKPVDHQFFSPGQICSQCNKKGHVEAQCFDTHPDLKLAYVASKAAKAAAKAPVGAARSAAIDAALLRRHEEVFGGGAYAARLVEEDTTPHQLRPTPADDDMPPLMRDDEDDSVDDDSMPSLADLSDDEDSDDDASSADHTSIKDDDSSMPSLMDSYYDEASDEDAFSDAFPVDLDVWLPETYAADQDDWFPALNSADQDDWIPAVISVGPDWVLAADQDETCNTATVFCNTLCVVRPDLHIGKRADRKRRSHNKAIRAGVKLRPLWTLGYALVPYHSKIARNFREQPIADRRAHRRACIALHRSHLRLPKQPSPVLGPAWRAGARRSSPRRASINTYRRRRNRSKTSATTLLGPGPTAYMASKGSVSRTDPGFLSGPLDSGATHLFVTEAQRGAVSFLDPTIIKRVRVANGQLITTTGSGLINGMVAHVGPFQANLISVPALLTIGIRSVFDLQDPHMLLKSGERYGEVTYSELEGFYARIPIEHTLLANPGYTVNEPDAKADQIVPDVPGMQRLRANQYPVNSKTPETLQMARLHRLFHAGARRLVSGVNKGHLIGSHTNPLRRNIQIADAMHRCMGCELGKARRSAHPPRGTSPTDLGATDRATSLFERVYFDTKSFAYPSWRGNYVMGVAVDDYSGTTFTMYARSRRDMEDELKVFHAQTVVARGHHMAYFRSDNAREFTSGDFKNWLTEIGCKQELTVPHTPEQNRAERRIESIMDLARTLRISNNFPKESWEEVTRTACYLEIRLPTLANPNETPPYTILNYGRPVDVTHMHEIGIRAVLHIDRREAAFDKYGLAGRPAVLIGYAIDRAGWRFLIDRQGTIQETDRATFFDKDFDPLPPVEADYVIIASEEEIDAELEYMYPAIVNALPLGAVIVAPQPVTTSTRGRGGRGRSRGRVLPPELPTRKSVRFIEAAPDLALMTKMSYSEAVSKPACVTAMTKEVADLIDNEKMVLRPTPPDRTPIGCVWAYKEKSPPEDRGTAKELYKARVCPHGFAQRPGVDYDPLKTASPTISLLSLAILHHICLHRQMFQTAIDFVGAFSNVPLKEEIYMRAPSGVTLPPGHSLLLKNSLQGTKQAAYNWFTMLAAFLATVGFHPFTVEPAMFYRRTGQPPNDILAIIGTHVDDLKCAFDSAEDFEIFFQQCSNWLACTRTDGQRYVGINCAYDRIAGTMHLSQQEFLTETLARFNMSDCKPCSTPAAPGSILLKNPEATTSAEVADFPLRDLVGCVLWAARCTYPEILYAVSQVGAHTHNFNATHVIAGKRVLRYLKGRLLDSIQLHRNPTELILEAASDANFMGEQEESEHPCRSTTSVVLWFRGQGFVNATSNLQPTVSHSTEEAEYRAGGACVLMVRIARNILHECGYPQPPTPMDQDNQACMAATTSATCSNRLRHIRNDHHKLREGFAEGIIIPRYCATENMVADIGTKNLPKLDFERHALSLKRGLSEVTTLGGESSVGGSVGIPTILPPPVADQDRVKGPVPDLGHASGVWICGGLD